MITKCVADKEITKIGDLVKAMTENPKLRIWREKNGKKETFIRFDLKTNSVFCTEAECIHNRIRCKHPQVEEILRNIEEGKV